MTDRPVRSPDESTGAEKNRELPVLTKAMLECRAKAALSLVLSGRIVAMPPSLTSSGADSSTLGDPSRMTRPPAER